MRTDKELNRKARSPLGEFVLSFNPFYFRVVRVFRGGNCFFQGEPLNGAAQTSHSPEAALIEKEQAASGVRLGPAHNPKSAEPDAGTPSPAVLIRSPPKPSLSS